jgi:hypothetical protein
MHRSFPQTLRAAIRRSTLFLNLYPGEAIRVGRRQCFALEGLGMSVETELLESEIGARVPGRSRRWLVQPEPISMPENRRAELFAMLAQLRDAEGRDGDWAASRRRIAQRSGNCRPRRLVLRGKSSSRNRAGDPGQVPRASDARSGPRGANLRRLRRSRYRL